MAKKVGAHTVDFCDLDPYALNAVKLNADRNNVEVALPEQWQSQQYDVLIAADVLYDITSAPDLMSHCQAISQWLLAETQVQTPPANMNIIDRTQLVSSTWPSLADFDQHIPIELYTLAPNAE